MPTTSNLLPRAAACSCALLAATAIHFSLCQWKFDLSLLFGALVAFFLAVLGFVAPLVVIRDYQDLKTVKQFSVENAVLGFVWFGLRTICPMAALLWVIWKISFISGISTTLFKDAAEDALRNRQLFLFCYVRHNDVSTLLTTIVGIAFPAALSSGAFLYALHPLCSLATEPAIVTPCPRDPESYSAGSPTEVVPASNTSPELPKNN